MCYVVYFLYAKANEAGSSDFPTYRYRRDGMYFHKDTGVPGTPSCAGMSLSDGDTELPV